MFAFPLRTSTRYPGGLDPQTVGRSMSGRQTNSDIWLPTLWIRVRTGWVQQVSRLWMKRVSPCAQREDDDCKQGSD